MSRNNNINDRGRENKFLGKKTQPIINNAGRLPPPCSLDQKESLLQEETPPAIT